MKGSHRSLSFSRSWSDHAKTAALSIPVGLALLSLSSCSPSKGTPLSWREIFDRFNTVIDEVSTPLQLLPSNQPDLPFMGVWVSTQARPLLLLLDTGTSSTVLRESLKSSIKERKVGQVELTGAQGGATTETIYSTSSLSIGDFTLGNESVTFVDDGVFDALSKNSTPPIDGFLGATLLQRGELDIDVPGRILTLRSFDRSQVEQSLYSLSLFLIPDINSYAIPLDTFEGKRGLFLLDTGTNAVMVLANDSTFGKAAVQGGATGTSTCQTLRTLSETPIYALPGPLFMAGHEYQKGAPVFVQGRRHKRLEGTLGIPLVWSSRRVILNHRSEKAAFDPIPLTEVPHEFSPKLP